METMAQAQRHAKAQAKGSNPGFYWLLGAIAIVGVGLLVWQMRRGGAVSIPANVEVLASDTAGFRGYTLGSDSAPVTVVEYGDYQCPGCGTFSVVTMPDVKSRLIDAGRIKWIYRDFPLDEIHPNARIAAHAAACAYEQEKFWPVHSLIFQGQRDWSLGNATRVLRGYAEAAGADLGAYDECMETARYAGRIEASKQEGIRLGVRSTPSFLIGDRLYENMNYDTMRRLVDSAIAAQPAS